MTNRFLSRKPLSVSAPWLKWIVALLLSLALIYLVARYSRFALTDHTVQKLLFVALSPIALIEYRLLRLRAATSHLLTFSAHALAV